MSIIEQNINIYIFSGDQDLLSKLIITGDSHQPPYQYWKYEL